MLPRLVKLPRRRHASRITFSSGTLIGHFLADLFPGTKILGYWHFRVTRNSELYIDEEEVAQPAQGRGKRIAQPPQRRRGAAGSGSRLPAPNSRQRCSRTLRLTEDDLYRDRRPAESHAADGDLRRRSFARVARPAVRRADRRRLARSTRSCSPPSASATFCCIIPTKISTASWSFCEQAAADPRRAGDQANALSHRRRSAHRRRAR